jgi:translation initiation factor 2 beta subunit (eIF-2beta)/eIF-5
MKNMIESKFGMKYPFPHTLIHIVDNSGFRGTVPVVTADDPSIFSTMVISGFPMGEDNVMRKLTRSDVVRVAYGANNLTSNDRKKYGQAIDYPLSLITQGAPVQLMRVTPEGSTYGFVTLQIRYKWDPDASMMHVKYLTSYEIPTASIHSNFKNPEKLAQAIIAQGNKNPTYEDDWTTRVLAVVVAAGRGKVYNNMRLAVNTVNQSKRPANAAYTFSTIDSRTSSVIEEFTASLVNIDNVDRLDYTETVNNQVHQRDPGSSVLKPVINEKAVVEVFNTYIKHYNECLQTGEYIGDEFINQAIKTLTVNTFDIITGKYLYNGGLGDNLPFFQVDAIDKDIPRLDRTNLLYNAYQEPANETDNPNYENLKDLMINDAYGVVRSGCSTYVGDIYLSTTGAKNANPRLSLVCNINQYSGAITSVQFDEVKLLSTLASETPRQSKIVKVYESTDTIDSARLLKDGIKVGTVVAKYIADANTGITTSFALYEVTGTDEAPAITMYNQSDVIRALTYDTRTGIENVISLYNGNDTDVKFKTRGFAPGFVVIDLREQQAGVEPGGVYVNDYDITTNDTMANLPSRSNPHSNHRMLIMNNTLRVGNVPTVIDGTYGTTLNGREYDVLSYPSNKITAWRFSNIVPADITTEGTGYKVGDIVIAGTEDGKKIQLTVSAVKGPSATGGIAKLDIPADTSKTISTAKLVGEYALTSDDSEGSGAKVTFRDASWSVATTSDNMPMATGNPEQIKRYLIENVIGSLFKIVEEHVVIPDDYYSDDYGINLDSEFGGIGIQLGDAGFFDDPTISDIEFKYRYAALLTDAFRGKIDPRITSPARTPAKFLFDAGYNTVVGSAFATLINHSVAEWINGSVVFTDDEKDEIIFDPSLIEDLTPADLDVKQAMYDLMIMRVYDLIPEERRPIGPGSGFSVHFDSCQADGNTSALISKSFDSRFTNPNASWDIGGYTTPDGMTYTYVKRIADNLIAHCKRWTINKPFTNDYTIIRPDEYVSIYPDIDSFNWEYREKSWNAGGNTWLVDENGYVRRMSQRTFKSDDETSDLIWESNMRTLSQLTYLLRQKIERYIFEYSDDSVLKTMKVECENMFSNWVGNIVESLTIDFERDTNVDGTDIVVCTVNVTFRGLVVKVPIIVNVNRRGS